MAEAAEAQFPAEVTTSESETTPKPRKPRKKRRTKGRAKKAKSGDEAGARKREGGVPAFPRTTLENALVLGNAVQQHGAGQKMRRLTLFEKLDKSPESGPSRMMVVNSGKYGITTGGVQAEFIELTELGQKATSPDSSLAVKTKARFDLAIDGIPPFRHLYELNKGKRVPSPEVMRDSLAEVDVEDVHRRECVELFLENAKFLGLLRTSAGAERLVPIEQVLEGFPGQNSTPSTLAAELPAEDSSGKQRDMSKVCFLIAPIGDDGTDQRKHSDMMLASFIERAMEGSGYNVVRADRITDPGMISGQVIDYLLNSALVIADLSFHNPNVFYELAIRHMVGKPTIHIIRKEDVIPFDVKDFRTIVVDTRDKYDLVAKLETYRAEISNHVRIAAAAGTEDSNPIRSFAKGLHVEIKRS